MPRSTRKALSGAMLAAGVDLDRADLASIRSRLADDDAAEDVAVAADPLGAATRSRDPRRARSAGTDTARRTCCRPTTVTPCAMGEPDQVGQVGDHDRRVGDRLEVQQPRVRAEGSFDGVVVRRIDEGRLDTEAPEHVLEQVRGRCRTAPARQRRDRRRAVSTRTSACDGGHAGREGVARLGAVQLGQRLGRARSKSGCRCASRRSPACGRRGCRPARRRPRAENVTAW